MLFKQMNVRKLIKKRYSSSPQKSGTGSVGVLCPTLIDTRDNLVALSISINASSEDTSITGMLHKHYYDNVNADEQFNTDTVKILNSL